MIYVFSMTDEVLIIVPFSEK